VPHEVDGPVNEHPPGVRGLTLEEQIGTGLDANLGTTPGQFRELIVGQAVEEADSAKLPGAQFAHQISPLGGLAACSEERLEGRKKGQPASVSALTWANCNRCSTGGPAAG